MSQQVLIEQKGRDSNLELYRILCMLMIVAHHFVVNSGLTAADGPLSTNPDNANSVFLRLFGMWGKTGINCFLMITGYFMCVSKISFKKLFKLLLQIYFYKLLLFTVFLIAGYEAITIKRIVKLVMPFWGFKSNFTSCFIFFYLTIPFLSILVQHLSKRQHQLLLLLTLTCYTVLGSVPTFDITFNYVTWFAILFFIASYIRLYPSRLFERKQLWGWLALVSVMTAMASVILMRKLLSNDYFLVSDSNKFFAVLVAVCSFLWFKNLNIKQSKIINAIGGSTFGVLLIHANSDAMRTWLWKDTVDCVGHYSLPLGRLVLFSFGVVLVVFIVCNLIDQLRISFLEKPLFKWYDRKLAGKVDLVIKRITNG